MTLLKIDDISYTAQQKVIIDQVSFAINSGQFVTLIGPNGAGKTTLLKIIIGLIKPQSGRISHPVNLNIGYVPQKLRINQLMPLKVKAFLELCILKENQQLIYSELGIEKLLHESTHYLSGGELQRVLLAQALGKFSHKSLTQHKSPSETSNELLILDEPTQGMDTHNQTELFKLLTSYNKNHGITVLMVSHDLNFVHRASSHVICLNKHICCQGEPQHISQMSEYQNLFPALTAVLSPYEHHHSHEHDRLNALPHNCSDHI